MKRIAITGAGGFLGFHLKAAALEYNIEVVSIGVGDKFDLQEATNVLSQVDELIHIAGVNRGTDAEVRGGNIRFAEQIVAAIQSASPRLSRLVFANSIQAGNGSIYGTSKADASEILCQNVARSDIEYVDVQLPNLFGEFGKPFYNSVVATFCHQVANGQVPEVQNDKELELLHAQDAVDFLLGAIDAVELKSRSTNIMVSEIKNVLLEFSSVYGNGEFPDLSSNFERDLFNTYRSYLFPKHAPLDVIRHADSRGSFFEIVRSNGGTGQTSFSTTVPGISRGDHFHRRKVERFTILAGEGEISLRRIFDGEVFTFRATGDHPLSVDMPTFYTHKIQNVGQETLYTAFWTNDIFNPDNPDTIGEEV